jgi:hypothetical protein
MGGTFEGLGMPLNGAFKRYAANGTTECLSVSDDGAMDFTFTDLGADNFITVVIADSTTVDSGYVQAFHTSLTMSGNCSTQINCFAADLTLGGTMENVEISGSYIYIAETGTASLTGSTISGYTVYFTAFGAAAANRYGVHAYSAETLAYTGSEQDAAFMADCSGTSGTWGAILGCRGTTQPRYLLHIYGAPGDDNLYSSVAQGSSTSAGSLAVLVDGTVFRIPLIADTCG